ncbi:expressed unknown protein [Seminavis robusta]|uniref:ShKT domain-containing protein n=1 Tax=Seminavis robusta TaxID=568900 RepID=A0A9N8EFE3_9STRA|nr:expressed unknown protein [Seminavis robusta]|eukprot:Sro1043_g234800.1 n/a (672) ;mRNA; f:12470-14661
MIPHQTPIQAVYALAIAFLFVVRNGRAAQESDASTIRSPASNILIREDTLWSRSSLQTQGITIHGNVTVFPGVTLVIEGIPRKGKVAQEPFAVIFAEKDAAIVLQPGAFIRITDVDFVGQRIATKDLGTGSDSNTTETPTASKIQATPVGRGVVAIGKPTDGTATVAATRFRCKGLSTCIDAIAANVTVQDSFFDMNESNATYTQIRCLYEGCNSATAAISAYDLKVERSVFCRIIRLAFECLLGGYACKHVIDNCTFLDNIPKAIAAGPRVSNSVIQNSYFANNGVAVINSDFAIQSSIFVDNVVAIVQGKTQTQTPESLKDLLFFRNLVALDSREGYRETGEFDSITFLANGVAMLGGVLKPTGPINWIDSTLYNIDYKGSSTVDLKDQSVFWGSGVDEAAVHAKIRDGLNGGGPGLVFIGVDNDKGSTAYHHSTFPGSNYRPQTGQEKLDSILSNNNFNDGVGHKPYPYLLLSDQLRAEDAGLKDLPDEILAWNWTSYANANSEASSPEEQRHHPEHQLCQEDPESLIYEIQVKSCAWLARRSDRMKHCQNPNTANNCPLTCGVCSAKSNDDAKLQSNQNGGDFDDGDCGGFIMTAESGLPIYLWAVVFYVLVLQGIACVACGRCLHNRSSKSMCSFGSGESSIAFPTELASLKSEEGSGIELGSHVK